jgi:hypothetical protein
MTRGVLALSRDESRDAHHHRTVGQAPARTARRAIDLRVERRDVHTRRQAGQTCRVAERSGQAAAGVLTEVGDDVAAGHDPPQQLSRAWQHGPADLVPVGGGHETACTCRPQCGREQSEWRGRTEPHRGGPVPAQRLGDAPAHRRRRREQRGRVPDDRKGLLGVEVRRSGVIRGVDDDVAGQPYGELMDEGLNAACPRREVVGDDEDPAPRCHRPILPDEPRAGQPTVRCTRRMNRSKPRSGSTAWAATIRRAPPPMRYRVRGRED